MNNTNKKIYILFILKNVKEMINSSSIIYYGSNEQEKKPHIINYEYQFKPGKRNTSP